jgi:hypothetical protein
MVDNTRIKENAKQWSKRRWLELQEELFNEEREKGRKRSQRGVMITNLCNLLHSCYQRQLGGEHPHITQTLEYTMRPLNRFAQPSKTLSFVASHDDWKSLPRFTVQATEFTHMLDV